MFWQLIAIGPLSVTIIWRKVMGLLFGVEDGLTMCRPRDVQVEVEAVFALIVQKRGYPVEISSASARHVGIDVGGALGTSRGHGVGRFDPSPLGRCNRWHVTQRAEWRCRVRHTQVKLKLATSGHDSAQGTVPGLHHAGAVLVSGGVRVTQVPFAAQQGEQRDKAQDIVAPVTRTRPIRDAPLRDLEPRPSLVVVVVSRCGAMRRPHGVTPPQQPGPTRGRICGALLGPDQGPRSSRSPCPNPLLSQRPTDSPSSSSASTTDVVSPTRSTSDIASTAAHTAVLHRCIRTNHPLTHLTNSGHTNRSLGLNRTSSPDHTTFSPTACCTNSAEQAQQLLGSASVLSLQRPGLYWRGAVAATALTGGCNSRSRESRVATAQKPTAASYPKPRSITPRQPPGRSNLYPLLFPLDSLLPPHYASSLFVTKPPPSIFFSTFKRFLKHIFKLYQITIHSTYALSLSLYIISHFCSITACTWLFLPLGQLLFIARHTTPRQDK